jgi:hypothetical protein
MTIAYGPEVFVELLRDVPEFAPIYDEHIAFYEELIPHVLFGDVTRFVIDGQLAGDTELVDRALKSLDRIMREGDDPTDNLVAVSFVEFFIPLDEPGEAEVAARFPPGLAEELRRMREWTPPGAVE